MADLRIVDAPEIPTNSITGGEKIPTGGNGNYSISLDSLADYTKTKKDLTDNTSVDNKVNGVRQELDAHIEDLLNPHQVTKAQIGLGNVDNTADADKPVSNSAQAAIISATAPKADKTYVDSQLALKANKVDVYTKQESSDLVDNSISTALTPVNASLGLAKRGIANRYDSSLTYNSGERVILTNGDIVKSLINGNTNDPNVDMTGWVKTNSASQIFDSSGKTQQEINDSQESKNKKIVSVKDYGAIGDGTLHTLQEWVDSGKFSGLLAIQVAYPTAASLTDSIDRVAIQTCIDQNVYSKLTEGSYWIDATIKFKDYGRSLIGDSVSSYGSGDYVRSKLLHKFNGDLLKINENLATTSPRGRNTLKNIGFISDDVFTGKAIRITSSQNHLINLSFYKFKDGAIRIGGKSYGTYIEKPSCDQCGLNGAYDISSDVDTGGATSTDYNTISVIIDGIFETSKTGAISLKESDPFYISRNYIEPFGSTSTAPMIDIKNSPSGNTKGWVYENYMGSINGNGFAINAIGSNIKVSNNIIFDFKSGIYFSGQTVSIVDNDVSGYTDFGIQAASPASNVNNNFSIFLNRLKAKSTGATNGIYLGNYINGGVVSGNLVRGSHTYGIRLYAALNTNVFGNNILPNAGGAVSGTGIDEFTASSSNRVSNNFVQATAKYNRYSWSYDEYVLPNNLTPTTGVWAVNDIVKVADPITFGAYGYICTGSGTGASAAWQKFGILMQQAATQADSTASDVVTLKADFNSLLAKLKAAKIMTT